MVTVELPEEAVKVIQLAYRYSILCRQDKPPYKGLIQHLNLVHEKLQVERELKQAILNLAGEDDGGG